MRRIPRRAQKEKGRGIHPTFHRIIPRAIFPCRGQPGACMMSIRWFPLRAVLRCWCRMMARAPRRRQATPCHRQVPHRIPHRRPHPIRRRHRRSSHPPNPRFQRKSCPPRLPPYHPGRIKGWDHTQILLLRSVHRRPPRPSQSKTIPEGRITGSGPKTFFISMSGETPS